MLRNSLIALALLGVVACGKPAPGSLSPAGVRIWQADQAVVALGETQRIAIGLNGVKVCDPAPCHPLLSDTNTRIVIDAVSDGIGTIHQVPAGWKATGLAALDRIVARLDAAGKTTLASYVDAARALLNVP